MRSVTLHFCQDACLGKEFHWFSSTTSTVEVEVVERTSFSGCTKFSLAVKIVFSGCDTSLEMVLRWFQRTSTFLLDAQFSQNLDK